MAPDVINALIREFIAVIHEDLAEAANLASAAAECAKRGSVDRAVEIANETDDLVHGVNQLLSIVATVHRTARRPPR